MTQLEWIDACANDLMLDGVDLYSSHFPRTDVDYLAQLKKLCADRCLTVAALSLQPALGDGEIDPQIETLKRWIDISCAVGAPLLRVHCGMAASSPGVAWRELIRGLKAACAHAKRQNVTLAMQPGDNSLIDSPAYMRRAFKEADSAWLRMAASAEMLVAERAQEWSELLDSTVIVAAPFASVDTFGADQLVDYRTALAVVTRARYRGFLSLEYEGAEAEEAALPRAVPWLRGMLVKAAA